MNEQRTAHTKTDHRQTDHRPTEEMNTIQYRMPTEEDMQKEPYLRLLRDVYLHGEEKGDRTGTGTRSLFGYQLRFDLRKGFPLVTTKKVHWKSIAHELLWFLRGETNVESLQKEGVTIWNEWANENGDLGPVYGKQWRSWEKKDGSTIDQIAEVIAEIKKNPNSRRLLVNAWNVADLKDMALQPCHTMFQFYVSNGRLSCQLYQRSADVFLGVPFNIASYALLTHLIAQACQLDVGDFVHTFGDAHLYSNHMEQAALQLSRKPFASPRLWVNEAVKNIDDFRYEDFSIEDYQSHPAIKGLVAV